MRSALFVVTDPQFGATVGDLGLLDEIVVGRGGRVRVGLSRPEPEGPDAAALRTAVEAAVREVDGVSRVEVVVTTMAERRRAELADLLRRRSATRTGELGGGSARVYAIASGKGGVGKSTVTANLAASLAARGKRVGILDADVWGHSIPQLFGVGGNPAVVGGVMLPHRAHGVALMSVGFLVPEGQPIVWRGPMLHKALEQFLTDVAWGELDVLLLDLPPGTGDITMSLLELVPDASLVAVTTPQKAARDVAARVVTMAREAGMPVAGVVENMSAAICDHCGHGSAVFGSGGGEELAELAGAPLLGRVPLDVAAREHADAGVPVVVADPGAPSAVELVAVAARLPVRRRSLLHRSLPLSVG
ncbi:Mrp/NBP35 family ATP-binding protein [Actinomycetospora soli]|uniref:Mrp/NBP35 family ATP-binding protein n=1 Tax=Actinomycetospora soli TaxID=2893887 RepID=UPI001E30EE2C|nr:Mrp/NBP35 family ATP-binding protein [Actinomycetospora soli]MCD2191085.1 Mrp/NBP35 family ATP-binding protein [Actinomycetospora soli]